MEASSSATDGSTLGTTISPRVVERSDHTVHRAERFGGWLSTVTHVLKLPPHGFGKPSRRQEVVLSDGGTIQLCWWISGDATIALLPGLNNDSRLPMIQHVAHNLRKHGFTVVIVDYRGLGGQSLKSGRTFGADSWVDLPDVFKAIRKYMAWNAPLFAMGMSMGGSCLVKYLSTIPADKCELRAAASMSAPLNLSQHMQRLESTPDWRVGNFLTMAIARLKICVLWVVDPGSRPYLRRIDWSRLMRGTRLRDLEAATICPMNGFNDPEDYYAFAKPEVSQVTVPLLVMHARDDPIIGYEELPLSELKANPNISLAITPTGGHLGYHGHWAEDLIAAHFVAHAGACWVPSSGEQPRSRL